MLLAPLAAWSLSRPSAMSRTKSFGLLFGVALIKLGSLFVSPAVEPRWHTAVAAWNTDRVVVPQLKHRLRDSQTVGVLVSSSLLAICSLG